MRHRGARPPAGERNTLATESHKFRKEGHVKGVVRAENKNAGERHAAGPTGSAEFGFGASFGNPAPKNAAAGGVEVAFGSVVRPAIEQALFFGVEDQFLTVEFANLPEDFSFCGVKQDVLFAEREEIGTLPHFAGIDEVRSLLAI